MSVITKEVYFGTGRPEKGTAKICFDESLFFADSRIYSHSLAQFCAVFSAAGYDMPIEQNSAEKTGISAVLSEFEMSDIECYPESLENEVGYFFAHREICCDDEKRTLIFAAFLGSRYTQWYTNFDAGTGEMHEGFKQAADFVFDRLNTYIDRHSLKIEKCTFLLTGHSRGAAAANLMAARMIDENYILPERFFTYTFASPTLTRSEKAGSEKYGGIYNIINDEDFVTRCMPPQWGYRRYGKTAVLPCKNNLADYDLYLKKVNDYYSKLVPGDLYIPYRKSTKKMDSLFDNLVKYVPDINAYYNKKFNLCGDRVSLHDFFEQSLCSIIGEPAGSKKIEQGTKMLVKTSIMRPASSRALRLISDFFILYEGLAGATKGKISKQYFSYAHAVYTYCSLTEAVSESQLKEINKDLR